MLATAAGRGWINAGGGCAGSATMASRAFASFGAAFDLVVAARDLFDASLAGGAGATGCAVVGAIGWVAAANGSWSVMGADAVR